MQTLLTLLPYTIHYKCAKVAIKSGKHVFIENHFKYQEAEEIITLANEYNVKGQVDMWSDLTRIYCH
jgi:predicted dehydrogenase